MQITIILLLSLASFINCATVASPSEAVGQISLLLESVSNRNSSGILPALKTESINTVNENGWSAALFAVFNYDIPSLQTLIENEIDLNIQDNDGISPLMLAASQVILS
jgi:ankyrin repeat protein